MGCVKLKNVSKLLSILIKFERTSLKCIARKKKKERGGRTCVMMYDGPVCPATGDTRTGQANL